MMNERAKASRLNLANHDSFNQLVSQLDTSNDSIQSEDKLVKAIITVMCRLNPMCNNAIGVRF